MESKLTQTMERKRGQKEDEDEDEEEEDVNEINLPQHCWKEFRGHQINTRPTAVYHEVSTERQCRGCLWRF